MSYRLGSAIRCRNKSRRVVDLKRAIGVMRKLRMQEAMAQQENFSSARASR
jgi:hypothetical protein